ncbi:MAG: ATP-binding cassette domain-containing protein, partial [Proteobacteria bacterium]
MISVDNLTVRFSGSTAVEDVSFKVAEGESFGLVGESGSGKSTILRTMVGLNRHWTGNIGINGMDARTTKQRDLARTVQMVFQDPYGSLHPRYTIGQQIAESMIINKLPDPVGRTAELLELIGLGA